MITPSTIYLITRATPISNILTGFALITGIASASLALFYGVAKATSDKESIKCIRCLLWPVTAAFAVFLVTSVAMPTSKELAAIIVIPKIANSESVQQFGDGIVALANQWLEELSPKKVEAK